MKKCLSLALAVCGVLLFLTMPGVSHAAALAPGGSLSGTTGVSTGDTFLSSEFGTIVADTGTQVITSIAPPGGVSFTVDIREVVVRDTVTPGNVDFLYQFSNVGANPSTFVAGISYDSFAGFTTDVGSSPTYANLISGAFTAIPQDGSITRGPTGIVISDSWQTAVNPGDGTLVLAVVTNATSWQTGSIQLIDGSVAVATGFGPAPLVATPEPGTLLLLGFGLMGLVGLGRKFKK